MKDADIVKRLRKLATTANGVPIFADAAAEIDRLRTALSAIIENYDSLNVPTIEVIENARPLIERTQ